MGPPSDAKGSGGSGSSKASGGGADYQHWIPGSVGFYVFVSSLFLGVGVCAPAGGWPAVVAHTPLCPLPFNPLTCHTSGGKGSGAPPTMIDEDGALLLKGEQPEQPQQKHGGFPSPEQPQVRRWVGTGSSMYACAVLGLLTCVYRHHIWV